MPDYTTTTGPTQVPCIRLVDASGQPITPLYSEGDQTINGSMTANSFKVGPNQVVGPRGAAVPDPIGGLTIDLEARMAIMAILARLRAHGLIA